MEIIASPKVLVKTMEVFRPDVVLLDMNFYTDINTGNEGLYWTGELKKMYPDVQIVLFTAYADIALAVEGMSGEVPCSVCREDGVHDDIQIALLRYPLGVIPVCRRGVIVFATVLTFLIAALSVAL